MLILGYIAWRMFKEPKPETTVTPEEYRLVPCDDQSKPPILLNQFPFSIGKDTARVNGAIEDPKISRVHAILTMEGGRIYLNDANSLNGTYVNQKRLSPQTSTLLQPGDYIGFANHTYQLTN